MCELREPKDKTEWGQEGIIWNKVWGRRHKGLCNEMRVPLGAGK